MDTYELKKQALEREHNRQLRMDAAFTSLPKRKTGELAAACDMAKRAHKLMCIYDLQEDPAPLSGITETWFDSALARIAELAPAPAAD